MAALSNHPAFAADAASAEQALANRYLLTMQL
jgi:hypothetical protein